MIASASFGSIPRWMPITSGIFPGSSLIGATRAVALPSAGGVHGSAVPAADLFGIPAAGCALASCWGAAFAEPCRNCACDGACWVWSSWPLRSGVGEFWEIAAVAATAAPLGLLVEGWDAVGEEPAWLTVLVTAAEEGCADAEFAAEFTAAAVL